METYTFLGALAPDASTGAADIFAISRLISVGLVIAITWFMSRRKVRQLKSQLKDLEQTSSGRLEQLRSNLADSQREVAEQSGIICTLREQLEQVSNMRTAVEQALTAKSSEALASSQTKFLELAGQKITDLQAPLEAALKACHEQVATMEKDRLKGFGEIKSELATFSTTTKALGEATVSVTSALTGNAKVRGDWGEQTLERVLELGGVTDHYCAIPQDQDVDTDGRGYRPDYKIMLPGDRVIVIDSKVALNAYVEHTKAEPEQAKQHLKDHAAAIRKHIRDLSSKDYQAKVPNETVDSVIMFIPGEHFLTAAVDIDPELLDYALSRNVVLATPHILCYLAKTVSSTWQQSQLTENAKELSKAGQAYFKRLHTLQEHLNKTGKSLNGTVSNFNAMVGSFDSQFVSGARRFSELGVIGCSDLSEPTVVESRARDSIKEVPQIADGDRGLPELRPL